MRIFTFLLALLVYSNAMAVAPYGFKGQNQSTTLYSNVLQAPNNQVTNLGGINALMETGNKNILSNPSFEAPLVGGVIPSWNFGADLPNTTVSPVIDGKKSAFFVVSPGVISLTQSSTLYASSFADGVQGLASVRVKSDVALKVCSIQAGVVSTTNCVDVKTDNKWGFYKVPFILGGTSNGISIASNGGSVTGTVYIDDAFVGATSLTQEMNACNDVNCETTFSATISNSGSISGENLNWLNTASVSASTFTVLFNSGIFSVAPNCTLTPDGVISTYSEIKIVSANSSASQIQYWTGSTSGSGAFNGALGVRIVCQKQGTDFTAAKQLSNGNTYSSTNADTDWEDKGAITVTSTGGSPAKGVTTIDKVLLKRTGTNAEIIYKYQQAAGVVGSGEYLYTLPDGLEFDTSVITPYSGAFSTGLELAGQNALVGYGHISTGTSALRGMVYLFAYNATQFRAIAAVTYASYGAQSASLYGYSNTLAFNFRINAPIAGWQQSNIIIGQFNGLESCASTLDCTDTFSAKISSAGVVSGENVEWLNGNCSVTSVSTVTCPFNTGIFTVEPNCTILTDSSTNGNVDKQATSSSTNLVYKTYAAAGGSPTAYATEVICQKQGVDYIGKTAKAVANDQNLRVPGVTKSVTYVEEVECDATSSLVRSLSGSSMFQSIGNISSGNCAFTLKSGLFTGEPYCTTTYVSSAANSVSFSPIFSTSTTGSIACRSGTAACSGGGPLNISCTGVSP